MPFLIRLVATLFLLFPAGGAESSEFVAPAWSDTSVHFLDENLADVGSFAAGSGNPNGIATDGTLIYTVHPATQEVVAYDLAGVESFRWSAPLILARAMEIVSGELAIARLVGIDFFNPATGSLLDSVAFQCPSSGFAEGIAFDGTVLWALCDGSIEGIDPDSGSSLASIPNAAQSAGCDFGGTGLTASAVGELTLACESGDWFQVSSADGAVLDSGNNSVDMYGIKYLPEPNGWAMLVSGCGALLALRRLPR
jgi:hypothetical protein